MRRIQASLRSTRLFIPLSRSSTDFRLFSSSSCIFVDQEASSALRKTRNIGIIAHIDAGKTTTTERMLYYSGHTRRIGNVDEGSTVTDFLEAERRRGVTIQSAAITFYWPPVSEQSPSRLPEGKIIPAEGSLTPHTINLIDTPGHADFTFEVIRSLRILDGAICILDGVAGVEAQTEKVWAQASEYKIPKIIYINKLDRDGAAFETTVRQIASNLRSYPAVCQIPWWKDGKGSFIGVGDVVGLQGLSWEGSKDGRHFRSSSPQQLAQSAPHLLEEIKKARIALVELLSDHDEQMVDTFLAHDEDHLAIPATEITASLRRATLDATSGIVPVFAGASFRNIGIQPLLDAAVNLLPNPSEAPDPEISLGQNKQTLSSLLNGEVALQAQKTKSLHSRHNQPRADALVKNLQGCALAFKVVRDPRGVILVYVRVYSGSISRSCDLYNTNLQLSEKAQKIWRMYAADSVDIPTLEAGQIGVIPGLKHTRTGDTLVSYAGMKPDAGPSAPLNSLQLRPIDVPPAVFFSSVEAENHGEEKAVINALDILIREDPSLRLTVDEDSGQRLLNGMGEFHLEIARDRLVKDFKAKASVGKIEIAYREAILAESPEETYISDGELRGKASKAGCSVVVMPQSSDPAQISTEENNDNISFSQDENLIETRIQTPDTDPHSIHRLLPKHLPAKDIHSALKAGALAALSRGINHGFPLAKTHVRINCDPAKHIFGNETTPSSLSSAARTATKKALVKAAQATTAGGGSALLELVMSVTISTDDASFGAVMNDITSSRGGHIDALDEGDSSSSSSSSETENLRKIDMRKVYAPPDPFSQTKTSGMILESHDLDVANHGRRRRTIRAKVPLKEMVGYLKHLRSLTGGRGTFTMEADRFERVVGQREKVLLKELRGY